MASLTSGVSVGNSSASSLIKSASSIQNEINTYNDSLAAYQFELSPKTDGDLATYQNYLSTRINTLQSTGSVTDASKALTLTKTLTTAVSSNTSANIQRENIAVMSGNGTLSDKYNTIVDQYTRATAIGDLSLAQSLESQAYSVSQSIQYQAQQAQQAGAALASANASSEGNVVTSLDDALKQLNNDITNLGAKDLNQVSAKWVAANKGVLQSLGAVIPDGAQPNYFNLVEGIQAAKYNALVLKAQSEAPGNPTQAQNTAAQASLLMNGATKISTLGGSLTLQQIQQAAQDPSMFAYDYGSGKYVETAQTGLQYVNGQVAPSFSGIVGSEKRNQIYYLNPNQTAELTGLGLTFKANANGTTGDGVQVQLSENSPQWLKSVLGTNGLTNVYTDTAGNLQFEGSSSSGQGLSYFTLVNVGGLSGIFEHSADGSIKLAGGNYGFDSGAAQLLINAGQQKQQQIQLQTQAEQAAQLAQIKISSPTPVAPLKTAPPAPTAQVQQTVSTKSIQPANVNPQPNTINPQGNNVGSGINQSGGGGIKLTQPTLSGIKL